MFHKLEIIYLMMTMTTTTNKSAREKFVQIQTLFFNPFIIFFVGFEGIFTRINDCCCMNID